MDSPRWNPGIDQAYSLALPTYAATAYYHHKLAQQPAALEPFLETVEQFALGDYMSALLQGAELPDARKQAVAEKLHEYTGLPVAYFVKSNLRVSGGEFTKMLQDEQGLTSGRLDTRYQGPDFDPLSQEAEYDPQSNAISSAYATAINQYMRDGAEVRRKPDLQAKRPRRDGFSGTCGTRRRAAPAAQTERHNVMPDLATTMKGNPKMKVMLAGGYYDLGCTYFGATYEDKHLQIPQSLQSNIHYRFFQTGRIVSITTPALKELHDATADFIKSTEDGTK